MAILSIWHPERLSAARKFGFLLARSREVGGKSAGQSRIDLKAHMSRTGAPAPQEDQVQLTVIAQHIFDRVNQFLGMAAALDPEGGNSSLFFAIRFQIDGAMESSFSFLGMVPETLERPSVQMSSMMGSRSAFRSAARSAG